MSRHWVLGAALWTVACGEPAAEPVLGCWRFEWEARGFAQPDMIRLVDTTVGSDGYNAARYPGIDTASYVPGDSLPWYRVLYIQRWRVIGDSIEIHVMDNGNVWWSIVLGPYSRTGVRSGHGILDDHQRQDPLRIGVHAFSIECPRGA